MLVSLARQKFQTLVLGIFAGVALLLATSGVYGVLSYLVAQRTPEMAVRIALGARPWALVRMIGVYGLRLVTLGVVIGLVGAAGFARLLAAFLFAVRPIDLPTFGCVTLVLAIVVLTACAVPARRASRTGRPFRGRASTAGGRRAAGRPARLERDLEGPCAWPTSRGPRGSSNGLQRAGGDPGVRLPGTTLPIW